MECYIIDRELTNEERQLIEKQTEVFITSEKYSDYQNKGKLVPELSDDVKKKINYDILEEILNFTDLKFQEKPILNHLKEGQFNLWFYHKFRLYFDLRNNYFEIEKIKSLENAFEKVILFTSNPFLEAYKGFAKSTSTKYSEAKNKLDKVSLIHFVLTSLLRLLYGLLTFKSYKNHQLIIDNRAHYKNMMDVSGQKEVFQNTYNGYLYDKINSDNLALIDVLPIPKFIGTNNFRFKWNKVFNLHKRNRIYEEIILFKGLLNTSLNEKRKTETVLFLDKLDKVHSTLDLNPIQDLIIWRLKNLNKSTSLYYFKYLAYLHFFNNNSYPVIASIDEYSANIKLIHDAAKSNSIKSVGIQHGTMHELHPGYIYSKSESDTNPFPDITILWGERWVKFLNEKGNYPLGTMSISGQIRTDIIPNIIHKKEEIKSSIGLPDKKILLFASQPQRDPKIRKQMTEDVFKAAKNLKEVLLVLKPHPLETDLSYFTQIAKSVDCHNYQIVTEVDLYQLLAVIDFVVTSFSTVGTEAVYFKLPLIIYDPLDQDVMSYIEDGVGIQVKNHSDLVAVTKGLMDASLTISSQVQEDFITNNAYKIDGHVCQRIERELCS